MPKQAKAPVVDTANAEDQDLPQTAVKPSYKEQALLNLQAKLAEFVDKEDVPPNPEPILEPASSAEEETFKKRYGDLRRHSQQQSEATKREILELKAKIDQLSHAANQPMPKTKEEFEEWKAKYPDIAIFIEMIADEKAGQRTAKLQEELGSVKETLNVTEKERALAVLKSQVPDYETLYGSKEFNAWLDEQPSAVRQTVSSSEDPHDLAKVFKAFKKATAKSEPAGKGSKIDKLAALDTSVKSSDISPSNTKAWRFTESQIAGMSTTEYEKNEAAILEARNAGLIMPNMTKRNTVFDV